MPCASNAHSSVVLVLDRTLTPAGERRLKDLRCMGRGSEFAWPSPGVFSIVKLCEKILVSLAQRGLSEGPRDLISNEELTIGLWVQEGCHPQLKTFQKELCEALKLAPLGLSAAEWFELRNEIEAASTSGDLRLWSERIYLYVQALAFASSRNKSLTPWDNVYRVVTRVSAEELGQLSWASLLERNPFRCTDLKFTVVEVQDPQPLEEALLRKLPLPLVRLRSESNDEFPLAKLSVLPLLHDEGADALSFAWAFDASVPGPVEAVTAFPGTFPIDVTAKTTEDDNEELRILSLYCAALAEPKNLQHTFYRYSREALFLKTWQLSAQPTAAEVLEAWKNARRPELSEATLHALHAMSLIQLSEAFAHLSESSVFQVERKAFTHARLDPRGAPLVTLADLPFMGTRHFALWGVSKDLEKHLSPTSTAILKAQDFPPALRKLLEARGHWMPDPEREQRALLGALASLGEALFVVEARPSEVFERAAPPNWTLSKISQRDKFSPSALEAYAECSMRYFIERVLRPSRIGDWDPVPVNAMDAGIWVHAVLEDFLKDPKWDNVESTLRDLLDKHRTKIFVTPRSSAYDRILQIETEILVEKLSEHLLNFERPLVEVMGGRSRLETESPLEGKFHGSTYFGEIDRLDHYGSEMGLLWDYKTGAIAQATSVKQIEKHKFQWHLYRALLGDIRPNFKIVGGGYINPLDPTKSRIIVFSSLFPPSKLTALQELCERLGHPVEVIDDEMLTSEALRRTVTSLRASLAEGLVSADGDETSCARCSSHALCGKPYLEGDARDGLA